MELTKEQIQLIDERLKRRGIKYWDLRIEMIDHVVSDIELNAVTNDFKIELENSLRRIGWQSSLRDVNAQGWKNVNKKYRKEYGKGILFFFNSLKNTLIFIFSVFIYYLVFEYFSFKVFKILSAILLILPVFFFLFYSIKQIDKNYGRSVNLDYGTAYSSFAFLMIGLPFQLLKHTSETNQVVILLIVVPIYYVATYSGYKVYEKAIGKVKKMKKEMSL